MEYKDLIIYNSNEFEKAHNLIKSVFNINQRLPEQVFNENFTNFTCEEVYFALSRNFWETLQQLARISNDTHIIIALLDPDPVSYFFKEFGYYNWFKLPVTSTAEEYKQLLWLAPQDSSADAMIFNSEVVVWVPLSGKWAVWTERSCDICILGFADKDCVLLDASLIGRWRPAHEGLEELLALGYKDQQVPKESADAFMENYSNNRLKASPSTGGKANIYERDGTRYAVRESSKSTKGPTVEFFKPGSEIPDSKIRLKG
jgi:hypothetical protein